jgi:hypothetical protein
MLSKPAASLVGRECEVNEPPILQCTRRNGDLERTDEPGGFSELVVAHDKGDHFSQEILGFGVGSF